MWFAWHDLVVRKFLQQITFDYTIAPQDIHTNMRNMQNPGKTWQSDWVFIEKGEFTRVEFTPHLFWKSLHHGGHDLVVRKFLQQITFDYTIAHGDDRLRTFIQIWGTCRTQERRDRVSFYRKRWVYKSWVHTTFVLEVSPSWRTWPRGEEISTSNFWLHNSSWRWQAQDHTNARNSQNPWKYVTEIELSWKVSLKLFSWAATLCAWHQGVTDFRRCHWELLADNFWLRSRSSLWRWVA